MFRIFRAAACVLLLGTQASLDGAEPLVGVAFQDHEFTGRVAARTRERLWVLRRDGRLEIAPGSTTVKAFSQPFQPETATEMRSSLEREFGRGYRVARSGAYVVVGRGEMAHRYATLFDNLYRDFRLYFSTRGFKLGEPEFPLVAVCFATRDEFLAYCKQEQARVHGSVVGVYLGASNRVALYEQPIASDVDSTVIHEATHQLAFNLGVHTRIGPNSRWVVEGLAEMFENPGFRRRDTLETAKDRINRDRWQYFIGAYARRRPDRAWERLIAADDDFRTTPLDTYSETWAFSFFLAETRPAKYSEYLRRMAARDPTLPDSPESRQQDFLASFPQSPSLLESEFLRFIRQLGS